HQHLARTRRRRLDLLDLQAVMVQPYRQHTRSPPLLDFLLGRSFGIYHLSAPAGHLPERRFDVLSESSLAVLEQTVRGGTATYAHGAGTTTKAAPGGTVELGVHLRRVGGLLFDARAVAHRELRYRVPHRWAGACPDHPH